MTAVDVRSARPDPSSPGRDARAVAVLGVALAVVLAAASVSSYARYGLVAAVVIAIVAVLLRDPVRAIPVVFAFLILLGTFRRALSDAIGSFPSFDALLVVPVVIVIVLFGTAVHRGALRPRTALSTAVLAVSALVVVGALNPQGGGLKAGVSGIFYDLTPMLWFWVGRALATDELLRRILRVFMFLALPVAVYGLVQSFGTFTGFDRAWTTHVGPTYLSLYVNGVVRPFGSFSSAGEYGLFLSVALVCLAAWLISNWPRPPLVGLVGRAVFAVLLGVALFFSSLRGDTVLTVCALAAMVAGWRRVGMARVAVYGAIAIVALIGLTGVAGGGGGGSAKPGGSSALLSHQVSGLANPLGSKSSTVSQHAGSVRTALQSVVHHPLGMGTGFVRGAPGTGTGVAPTAASGTLPTVKNSDVDLSNAGISWGVPGLVAFTSLVMLGVFRAYAVYRNERTWVALVVLGLVVVALLRWMSDMYAVLPLLWMSLGWVDRRPVEPPVLSVVPTTP